jgi:hypothetical protein
MPALLIAGLALSPVAEASRHEPLADGLPALASAIGGWIISSSATAGLVLGAPGSQESVR